MLSANSEGYVRPIQVSLFFFKYPFMHTMYTPGYKSRRYRSFLHQRYLVRKVSEQRLKVKVTNDNRRTHYSVPISQAIFLIGESVSVGILYERCTHTWSLAPFRLLQTRT